MSRSAIVVLLLALPACPSSRQTAPQLAAEPRSCIAGAVKQENDFDADGDGTPEKVEVIESPAFKYPHLARWKPRGELGPEGATWAVADHLLVTFKQDKNLDQAQTYLRNAFDLPTLKVLRLPLPKTYLAEAPPPFRSSTYLLARASELRLHEEDMERVSPDYLYFSIASGKTPNDPLFSAKQDDLMRIGAQTAWKVTSGDPKVRIAVLDTGVITNHPDLQDNLARRTDGTILGWDFHNGRPVPEDDHPDSHGTRCAGIIGAEGDNTEGIAGVNWQVSIIPIKFLDASGCGTTANAIEGIKFAVDEGAVAISNSWGGAPASPDLQQAVQLAAANRVLFVAGAGNDNRDLERDPFYPASFPEPNMISVGATFDNGKPVLTWGHSAKRVHISAPGIGVFSTVRPTELYRSGNGTSFSTAFVSGACALLRANGLTYLDIRTRILTSSKDLGTIGATASCSRGLLDLANAVQPVSLRNVTCP